MVILFFVGAVFATEKGVAYENLVDGRFGMDTRSEHKDSINGVYLRFEEDWGGEMWTSPHYLRLFIGSNLDSSRNERVWVLTDYTNVDSLNSELKNGNKLELDKFVELKFDPYHLEYLLDANIQLPDIEMKRRFIDEDSLEYYPSRYFDTFFLYQKKDSLSVLCGVEPSGCFFRLGCFYHENESLIFDSLPDPDKWTKNHMRGCPLDVNSLLPSSNCITSRRQNNNKIQYKINGVSSTDRSSNVIIKGKKSVIQLKGNN
jgi:hypothetical protein